MWIQSRIFYPLTALITINTRMSLLTSKAIIPAVLVSLPLALVIVLRVVFAFFDPPQNPENDAFGIYSVACASLYLQFVVPILALQRGISAFSEEIEEGTIMFLRLRPVPRIVIVFGKYLAYALSSSILLVLSLGLTYTILSTIPYADMFVGDFHILVRDMWVLCLGLLSYGAVMMLIGTYCKRPILVGLFLLFLWDGWAAYIPGSAHKFTIKHYLQSLFPHRLELGAFEAMLGSNTPAAFNESLLTLSLVIGASVILTTIAFQIKELKGNQAEK